jgi:hypothetical protein
MNVTFLTDSCAGRSENDNNPQTGDGTEKTYVEHLRSAMPHEAKIASTSSGIT